MVSVAFAESRQGVKAQRIQTLRGLFSPSSTLEVSKQGRTGFLVPHRLLGTKMCHLSGVSGGVAADFCALNEVVSHKEKPLGELRYSNP